MPILSLQLMLNWPVTLSDRSASGKSIIQLIAAGERACQVRIWELSHVLRCFPSSLLFLESNSQSGFPGGASGKEPTCQRRRHKWSRVQSLGRGRSPGGERGNTFQYSCPENPKDRRGPLGLQSPKGLKWLRTCALGGCIFLRISSASRKTALQYWLREL